MLSIKSENTVEWEIQKSKFIGLAFYVENEIAAQNLIDQVKALHPKATHVCYGLKTQNAEKFDDNGEPSFTAGMPILNVITKQKLNNVLVCVVRYFGGVKLGAGGLVRAYGKTASMVLKLCETVELLQFNCYKISLSYEQYNQTLAHLLKQQLGLKQISVEFLNQVEVVLGLDAEKEDQLNNLIVNSFGNVKMEFLNSQWLKVE